MIFDVAQLRKIRKQLDLTQHQLAKEIGISQSMVAKIESGKLDPTYSYVKKIEDAINSLTKHKEKEAKDIMIKKIISVKPKDNMKKVVSLMNKYAISQLPVIEKEKVIGLVTESDILGKKLESVEGLKVEDLMTKSPPLISKDTNILVITSLLKHFPVVLVSEKGKAVGLIAKSDLLKILV